MIARGRADHAQGLDVGLGEDLPCDAAAGIEERRERGGQDARICLEGFIGYAELGGRLLPIQGQVEVEIRLRDGLDDVGSERGKCSTSCVRSR